MKTSHLSLALLCAFILAQLSVSAQEKRDFGAALSLTTNGVGVEGAMSLNKKKNMSLRANFLYLPLSYSGYEMDFGGTKLLVDMKGTLGSTGVYYDYHPLNNIFKVTGGIAYMFTTIGGTAKLRDQIKQGELIISPDKVGIISFDVSPNHLCPYLAVGVGRAIPKKKFGFNFELGTYYGGSPKVNFTATEMLAPCSANQAIIAKNMEADRWIPQLSFNITYRINN